MPSKHSRHGMTSTPVCRRLRAFRDSPGQTRMEVSPCWPSSASRCRHISRSLLSEHRYAGCSSVTSVAQNVQLPPPVNQPGTTFWPHMWTQPSSLLIVLNSEERTREANAGRIVLEAPLRMWPVCYQILSHQEPSRHPWANPYTSRILNFLTYKRASPFTGCCGHRMK